jgi:hypothetical protein
MNKKMSESECDKITEAMESLHDWAKKYGAVIESGISHEVVIKFYTSLSRTFLESVRARVSSSGTEYERRLLVSIGNKEKESVSAATGIKPQYA